MGRVGTKRSDKRWRAPDGTVWDSRFEYQVFEHLRRCGSDVRRCEKPGDSFDYLEPQTNVRCMDCGSSQCSQRRVYTPDFYIVPKSAASDGGGYYLEAKGYFRRDKRVLFRCFRNSRPEIDLRVVFEKAHWVTSGKTRITDYFDRYLKTTPYVVGINEIPEEWL